MCVRAPTILAGQPEKTLKNALATLLSRRRREYLAVQPQTLLLEQRQNKNDSIQSKIIPIFKYMRFSPHRKGGGMYGWG